MYVSILVVYMMVYYNAQWLKSQNLIIFFPRLSQKAILINHQNQNAIPSFHFERSQPNSPMQAAEKLVDVSNKSPRFYGHHDCNTSRFRILSIKVGACHLSRYNLNFHNFQYNTLGPWVNHLIDQASDGQIIVFIDWK